MNIKRASRKKSPAPKCRTLDKLICKLVCKTWSFNTLDKVSLEKYIHNKDRCDRKQTTCFKPYDYLSYRYRLTVEELLSQVCIQVLQHKSNSVVLCEEWWWYIVVVPIPNDREQEYCQERWLCVRTHDNKECFQWAAAVEVCSIFKLLRKSSEELTEDKDKQTCTESVCKQCRKIRDVDLPSVNT